MTLPALHSIYFSPSVFCNLKCRHCWLNPPYSKERKELSNDLTLSEILQVMKDALPLGLKTVKITGGEPFIRRDILDILKRIHDLKISLQLETNGVLLDEAAASVLGKIYREDKAFFLSLSLDGDEALHDYQRGVKGAYQAVLNGMRHLQSQEIPFQIICSIGKVPRSLLLHVGEIAKQMKASSIKFNFINNMERAKQMDQKQELLDVAGVLEMNQYLTSEFAALFEISIFTNLPPAFKTIQNFSKGGRCGILHVAGLLNDGGVSFCGIGFSSKALIAGNIRRTKIETLWKEAALFADLRESVPLKLQGICGDCMLKAFCLGQCRADAFYKQGSLKAPFEFCQKAREESLFPEKWIIKSSTE